MRLNSKFAYAWWRLSRSKRAVMVRLKQGITLNLRPLPASDLYVAHEMFVGHAYRPPRPISRPVKRIVDAGANVGLSCLYWTQEFPGCTITAFEPVPLHVELIRQHLQLNPAARVDLHAAAACARRGTVRLAAEENRTHVVDVHEGAGTVVPAEDFFEQVGTAPIDLLKIDIEGGEYELLGDSRFESVDAAALVIEWHNINGRTGGREYCCARLAECGYSVQETVPGDNYGVLWAFKELRS